ncbi:hypothetical protein CAPTEDRAFT_202119 [Capitella teleta]|uniref:Uncharacterized protein n=1 Tax=Capitella teleta TaxID=283909 RepID=R7U3L0_CAPTE|nr:hypothetical protein CAPTEDRAFT_202119 [Capitella teleta]|eukprot:ELU00721.1 hypothetical protein CAPTEDRAFT_202119 [Capitella teleta]
MKQIEDKVLDQFADIDQKWRDSCIELACLEQLERGGQLPEWDYNVELNQYVVCLACFDPTSLVNSCDYSDTNITFIEQRKKQDTLPAETFKVAVSNYEERQKDGWNCDIFTLPKGLQSFV